jgi:hypothetical protein
MTLKTPIHTLPAGYIQARHLVATEGRTLLWLNLASLAPLGLALIVMGWWWALVRQLRGPYSTAFSEQFPAIIGIAAVLLITLGGHEALHGLAIRLYGHKPRFGIALNKGVMYATTDNAVFPRNQFIAIALAPLVVMTLVGMIVMILVPDTLGHYVGLIVALNAAGAIGDLWMAAVVMRYSPDTLVRDEADSIRIYVFEAANT